MKNTQISSTTSRVTSTSLGGAITILGFYALTLSTGVEPPTEIVVASTTIVTFITQAIFRKLGTG